MRALPQGEQEARQRNLLFFTQPRLWPTWPFLPLVRRRAGQDEECGLLFDARHACGLLGYAATVLICNFFLMPKTLDEFWALPRETYDTPEEIADAEWMVD